MFCTSSSIFVEAVLSTRNSMGRILIFLSVICVRTGLNFAQVSASCYLNQSLPGNIPVVFAPGIISTKNLEHSAPAFSSDGKEVYWSVISMSNDTCYQHILVTKYIGNQWTAPVRASISSGFLFEGGPVISTDGNKIYIYRGKPSPPPNDYVDSMNIVCYTKLGNEWTNPVIIGEGGFHSIANNKTIYYFYYKSKIKRRAFSQGAYLEPELLNVEINNPAFLNWTPYIAPDDSYLIFSRHINNGDLYIAFHDTLTDQWTKPVSMGSTINTAYQERFPNISPDGKYLFFTRNNASNQHDIYWVKADSLIASIKKKVLGETAINESKETRIKVFPNPINGELTISFGTNPSKRVTTGIYNTEGKLALSKVFINTTTETIDLSGFQTGIYMVRVFANGVCYEEKIIIE